MEGGLSSLWSLASVQQSRYLFLTSLATSSHKTPESGRGLFPCSGH